MAQEKDGGYIIPEIDILRNYIEEELEEEVVIKGRSELLNSDEIKSKKITRFEDESWEEVITQMKDINKKIRNSPAEEAHVNEAPKEVNPMKDVLEHLKEISEAVNPQKRSLRIKTHTRIRISTKFTTLQTKKYPGTFNYKLSTLCASKAL
ncbi:hypothetical protein O181_119686 [Austropuccinia psidii MF-1]|uniref:Uncharacterized protein n=1 Tax=Austropuccinia psidii MF-1 TaxID=1389203 RepID=A0A9Q3KH04_9BASI|nr:hypothetical protein [Austropuccinia psidii MF-1]